MLDSVSITKFSILYFSNFHSMSLVEQAKEFVFPLLEKSCGDYPYHNPNHTQLVYNRASYLGLAENVNSEDLEDLQIACIFHDTGFTEQYEKNEFI